MKDLGLVQPRWAHLDSNQGPTGYEPAALTAELWAPQGPQRGRLAVPTGFEPAIFSLTGRYARPLHYGTSVAGAPQPWYPTPRQRVGRVGFEPT